MGEQHDPLLTPRRQRERRYIEEGKLVARLRERAGIAQAGITQEDLATLVGHKIKRRVRPQTVSAWERGETRPKYPTAVALDQILKAGDAILAAYNYAAPGPTTGELDEKIDRLDRFAKSTAQQLERVATDHDARLAALERGATGRAARRRS